MKVDIPVELIDEKCLQCRDLDIYITFCDVWDNNKLKREWYNRCSHLELCKRLKERYKKNDD